MKPIGMTKMKHLLKKEGVEILKISNIRINGNLRGCSGFVRGTSHIVYFTTEPPCQNFDFNGLRSMMYREARNENDYSGFFNRWCTPDELPREIGNLANANAK